MKKTFILPLLVGIIYTTAIQAENWWDGFYETDCPEGVVACGTNCGTNCSWELDSQDNLRFFTTDTSSTGEIGRFDCCVMDMPPWVAYKANNSNFDFNWSGDAIFNNVTIEGNATKNADGIYENTSGITNIGTGAAMRARSVEIPTSVSSIGDHALVGFEGDSLTIPDSVTSLGKYSIDGNFTSITIPDSVVSIGDYAFSENQKTIIIGDGVTSISKHAFRNLYNEGKIYCKDEPEGRCSAIFEGVVYWDNKTKTYKPISFQTYTIDGSGQIKIGNRTYSSLSDMASGNYIKKRIYTLDEANAIAKPTGNTVRIKYR